MSGAAEKRDPPEFFFWKVAEDTFELRFGRPGKPEHVILGLISPLENGRCRVISLASLWSADCESFEISGRSVLLHRIRQELMFGLGIRTA